MDFLESLGFNLFSLGMSDTWVFYQKGEIFFKVSQTISGKMIISDSSNKVVFSSREKNEVIDYLTTELRNLKIDKLL